MQTYSLYWTDISGTNHTEFRFEPIHKVKEALSRLLTGPGRMVVKEIKVVGALDCLCFHSIDGVPVGENGNPIPPKEKSNANL